MSQFKGKKESKVIDFNNEQDFRSIVQDTLNGKLKGKKNIAGDAISFLTRNGKSVAIFAAYLIISGIGFNIYGIISPAITFISCFINCSFTRRHKNCTVW